MGHTSQAVRLVRCSNSDERMTAGQGLKQEDRLEIVMEILEVFTRLWHERVGDDVESFDLIRLLQRDENTANMVDDPMNYIGNLMFSSWVAMTPRVTRCLAVFSSSMSFPKICSG